MTTDNLPVIEIDIDTDEGLDLLIELLELHNASD